MLKIAKKTKFSRRLRLRPHPHPPHPQAETRHICQKPVTHYLQAAAPDHSGKECNEPVYLFQRFRNVSKYWVFSAMNQQYFEKILFDPGRSRPKNRWHQDSYRFWWFIYHFNVQVRSLRPATPWVSLTLVFFINNFDRKRNPESGSERSSRNQRRIPLLFKNERNKNIISI